ncbi:MAG: hypothetical protein QOK29_4646, partial [Rhodospirillaceae bacterium]|nr:hypothetical protein [Rhodospirillaceae bacterium]
GDLRKLYADNTWFWPDGAAFFAESGRFRAWSGSGQKASYALGMWWVNDHGSLCFDASWHSKDGAKESTTCFTHRQSGDVLYQKREPSGAWYVFRSNPVKLEDEIKKLKSGDLVEVKVQAVQAQLGTATP